MDEYNIIVYLNMQWVNKYKGYLLPNKHQSSHQYNKDFPIASNHPHYLKKPSMAASKKECSHPHLVLNEILRREFKDSHFTIQSSDEQHSILLDFTLLLHTQYQQLSVLVSVELNQELQYIRYKSFLLHDYQMVSFPHEQAKSIARYISINFNKLCSLGCMSIDFKSGQLMYQVINNSLGQMQERLMMMLNELVDFIRSEIKFIQNIWLIFLPKLFKIIHYPAQKQTSHPFWLAYVQAQSVCESLEARIVDVLLKDSYIEYPFMFDEEQIGADGDGTKKKIRSKPLSQREKNKKRCIFNEIEQYGRNPYKLTNDLSAICAMFASNVKAFELDQSNFSQLFSKYLNFSCLEFAYPIYTQMIIQQVLMEKAFLKSSFSFLQLHEIICRRVEDGDFKRSMIVAKQTQQNRFINETQILKIIGKCRSPYIGRFFYCKKDQYRKKILLEYCPTRTFSTLLLAHQRFISFSSKLQFLLKIASGIRVLRDHGVIHNDLKPSNILIKLLASNETRVYQPRIIDFGEASSTLLIGNLVSGYTIPYAAPEQVRKCRLTEKVDVFSLGVIIYEAIFEATSIDLTRIGKEGYIRDGYLRFYAMSPEKIKYHCFPKIARVIYQLCLRCLDPDPKRRPFIDWIIIILGEIFDLNYLQNRLQ